MYVCIWFGFPRVSLQGHLVSVKQVIHIPGSRAVCAMVINWAKDNTEGISNIGIQVM